MPTDKLAHPSSQQPGQQLINPISHFPAQLHMMQVMLKDPMLGQQWEQQNDQQRFSFFNVHLFYEVPGNQLSQSVLSGQQQKPIRGYDPPTGAAIKGAGRHPGLITGNEGFRQQERHWDRRRQIKHDATQEEAFQHFQLGQYLSPKPFSKSGLQDSAQYPTKTPSKPTQHELMTSALLSGQLQRRPRQFSDLPPEIQFMVFTEAICKPNIHFARPVELVSGQVWTFNFAPMAGKKDKSGYRQLKTISAVNRLANEAVRLATKKNELTTAQMPFTLRPDGHSPRFDGAEDLVFIDFPKRSGSTTAPSEFMHNYNQYLTATLRAFNNYDVALHCKDVQKLALKYSHNHHTSFSPKATFRCARNPTNPFDPHQKHGGWRMCPEELFAFVNCFPKLCELCIVLEPSRTRSEKACVEQYLKNYYTRDPRLLSLRHSLTIYHATDHAYIELHPTLMISHTPKPKLARFRLEHLSSIRKMLDEMKNVHLLRDTSPDQTAQEAAQWASMYRMTLRERKALVCKVLIATNALGRRGLRRWRGWKGSVGEVRDVLGV
ncbi:hypothetical protein N0V88_007717 [Collariella sp. IMI 366227]|nr:hypothetical protein N0V88_007717 [Collariella sp. IMI 366227]